MWLFWDFACCFIWLKRRNNLELWFVRHGKAEQRIDLPDEQRQLVMQGQEDVKRLADYLRQNLQGKTVTFWSSPLVRAKQTVETLTTYFQIIPQFDNNIAKGDLEQLLPLWEHESAQIQIIVGHEPTLSRWVYQFTHKEILFKTAELVKINVKQWQPLKGEWIESIKAKDLQATGNE